MTPSRHYLPALILLMLAASAALAAVLGVANPAGRLALDKMIAQGNYKEAYEGFRKLALDPNDDPKQVGDDLQKAVNCLVQLGRAEEIDDLREEIIRVHRGHWRLLASAAESYLTIQNHGAIVAGKFHRGGHRGDGRFVSSQDRDRVRALQLMEQARPLLKEEKDRAAVGRFYLLLARILMGVQGPAEAWRLQALTDLKELPDYEEGSAWGWHDYGQPSRGAPVEPDGSPVFYQTPRSFEAAKNDGERWRWALAQAVEADAGQLNAARMNRASFLLTQFGVQAATPWGVENPGDRPDDGNPAALESLTDDETIARLATGVKRLKLPEEFNPIALLRAVADEPRTGYGEEALAALAQIYEQRRQLDRAADTWKRSLRQYGDGNFKKAHIDQILGNWGQFEANTIQPAGRGATLDLLFRNGSQVTFEARPVHVGKLLDDLKAYLKKDPGQLDWEKINLGNLGYRLVERNEVKYVGPVIARWDLGLKPQPRHLDTRVRVTTPLQKAGAYLVTARMARGNVSRIIVWIDDTVIVKKPLEGKTYYFVADAVTGQPIARANLELFGYRQEQIPNKNQFRIVTRNFAEHTDADGQVIVPNDAKDSQYQWLILARAGDRFAHLGFTNVWSGQQYEAEYNEDKVFSITDRPVYRPKQSVKFKFWVRHAQYDQADTSSFAGQEFPVEIYNPKGEKVFSRSFKADAYGGFDGAFELPSDTPLGVYQVAIPNRGGGQFRVEEYKKPEFEVVVDAPREPVMLGERVKATIRADYFFGAPVTRAKVKYKVLRSAADERWYPLGAWDWLYGPGYWWFAPESPWYPGWRRWGCLRPIAWWWGGNAPPPEVVAEADLPIGPDGKVAIEIDTALAKAAHSDQDHRYEITAEVVDESRRTIVGTGTVLVARQPFRVFTWVDRGHYKVGDTIRASLSAHTLDHKPVTGKGTLTLLKVSYDATGKPSEEAVQSWDIATDAQGEASQQIAASAAGQYRISAKIDDGRGHTIEGGYLLVVTGPGFDGRGYRFNDLELVADRREYRPGESVRMMVNTNRPGSTVLLFAKPANGIYLPPKVVRPGGKSVTEEIAIVGKDMPNVFVEALTVADGKVHDEVREIVVPPESRVLGVELSPSQPTYKPGEKARVRVKLTGPDGKPFAGSTVLAVYDKSVESIAGGSNVPDIKEYFWKWRRTHSPQTEDNLSTTFANLLKSGEAGMESLGSFYPWGVMGGFGGGWVYGRGLAPSRVAAVTSFNGAAAAPMAMAPGELQSAGGHARGKAVLDMAKSEVSALAGEPGPPASTQPPAPEMVQPTVRKNFADTAYWAAALNTGDDGTAEVEVPMPESLTTWKVKCWGMGHGTKVGQADAEVVTRKDVLVRLQAPRFFVEKDEVVLSANVHNALKDAKSVQVMLELDGNCLTPLGESVQTVEVAAGGERRVDWRVKVTREGQAVVRMKALTDSESDAMELPFPVYVHGMLKTESWSGAIRPDGKSAGVAIRVPAERRPDQTRLEVRFSPTLAGALVDALPYLADYPYGCTEQTLNRFLPTVITQKTLLGMGLDLKAIRDKRINLNAQEIGDPAERAKGWKRFPRNPVFDADEVAAMVKSGLSRLTEMQIADGGWGWFSGFGEHSYAHTTAIVVHGLQTAQQNDVALVPGVLDRGIAWLKTHQAEQVKWLRNFGTKTEPSKQWADDLDAFVFMVLVDSDVKDPEMLEFLERDRPRLSVYAKAMYGLALERLGERQKLDEVLRNIRQFLVQDEENQTAYLKLPNQNYWWSWYGSETESHAYYLKLLARVEPKGETAARLAKYMINNRKHASYWESTRDTALSIEALAEFLKASGEDKPDMTVAVAVDGAVRKEVKITPADLFTFDNVLVLSGDALTPGAHRVEVRKEGKGPLYFNAYLTNFTLEDPIRKAGLEVKVDRRVYKLVREEKLVDAAGARGQALKERAEKYRREALEDGAVLKSGDLVEVELEIDSKNDYEYLLFEDMKAAGFEPVELRSGYNGNDLGAYVEFRDERVAFFVRALSRGKHSVAYRLRAEIPGVFHALPCKASAMYAPELRGNSDEIRLKIED